MKLPKPIKRGDAYRIQFMHAGQRYSATRDTARECEQWAAQKMLELKAGADAIAQGRRPAYPVARLMDQYEQQVGSKKRSYSYIRLKIANFKRDFPDLAAMSVHDVTPEILTKQFKEVRLRQVQPATFLREVSLYSAIFTYAIKELFLIKDNPFFDMSKPEQPAHRDRRVSDQEIDAILAAAQYERGQPCKTNDHWVAWCFLFAIETTMRQGEIMGIRRIDLHDDYVALPRTKNGSKRDVPLTAAARDMLTWVASDDDYLVPIRSRNTFLTAWERVLKRSGVTGMTFHDSRHEGITRMVHRHKLPVEVLAKITGHKRIDILVNTYYNPTAIEIARMLS